jgi:hypothetical protein
MFCLNFELIQQIEEFFNIKMNNVIEEFKSDAENIKRQMSAKNMLNSGNTLILTADMAVKKFENFLDECLNVYKETYEGNINKIYCYSDINRVINVFNIKQKKIEDELNNCLNEEYSSINLDDKAKEKALERFTNSVNSINCINTIRIKTYSISILKKSWKSNFLIKILQQTVPVLIGVLVGYYIK